MRISYGSDRRAVATAKGLLARHGIKAAIIVAGGIVAAETATHSSHFLPATTAGHVVARVDKTDSTSLIAKLTRTTKPGLGAAVNTVALDAGVEHSRINFWINRLTTALRG